MIKRTITVEIHDDGGSGDYTVREGDRYCPRLCWDEMLGSVAELTHPRIGESRYRMLTAGERAERERKQQACIEANMRTAGRWTE